MFSPLKPLSRRRTAVAAVYLGTFMSTLAISIVTVALPAIQRSLRIDFAELQWIIGSYALCLSAFMLSAGPLGDRYGRKRTWLCGVTVFVTGSTVCAAAPDLVWLIAGCMIQGIAGAFVIPGSLSILTQAFPDPHKRAHVIGGWSSFSGVSLILGPMLGGALVDMFGWPSIFLINLPVGLAALVCGVYGISESADPDHAALDPLGQGLSVLLLGTLTYGLIAMGRSGLDSGAVLSALGIALMAAILFVVVELRVARPVLPIDLFADRNYALANGASFVLGFSGYTSLFLFSLFLQQGQGWSPAEAGWRMAPVFTVMALTAARFGRFAQRFGSRHLMVLGYGLLGLSMLTMALFAPKTPYLVVAPIFALLGVGMGLAIPATGAAAMHAAPRERTGAASATMNALRQSGMTLGIALLGAVMASGAVARMTTNLGAVGVTDPVGAAADAIRKLAEPAALSLSPEAFHALIQDAVAHGFTLAVAAAGTLGLATTLALVIGLRDKPARTSTLVPASIDKREEN